MKKVFLFFLISIVFMLSGCSNENSTYNLEQFENAMKDEGYNFEIQDIDLEFLSTTSKRMVFDDIVLDIYVFRSNKKMEKEARNIHRDGWGYSNGSEAMQVDWVSAPHFYKKGELIVQYIGEDKNIISDLEDILDEQFAGQTLQYTDNPENKIIGNISNFDTSNNSFEFDEIERITLEDTDRIKELNLNPNIDLPSGFYINNPTSDTKIYTVTNETEYNTLDLYKNIHSAVDVNSFVTYINEDRSGYSIPFWIVIKNNKVISIEEQYVP